MIHGNRKHAIISRSNNNYNILIDSQFAKEKNRVKSEKTRETQYLYIRQLQNVLLQGLTPILLVVTPFFITAFDKALAMSQN